MEELSDIHPRNGTAEIEDEKRTGDIEIDILSDSLPELTETFQVVLTGVEGGAEIDNQFNKSTFRIK